MASKFNFGKRLRVTGHEYRKLDYGAALRCGCSCENRFVSKRWHPSFKGRKKYQSVALESSFRMIYCLLIFDDPVNLNVIYNSNIDTYLPLAPAIIKIKSWNLYRRICFIKAHLQICNMTKSGGLGHWRTQDFLKVGPSKNYSTQWPVGCEISTSRKLTTMLQASSVLPHKKSLEHVLQYANKSCNLTAESLKIKFF